MCCNEMRALIALLYIVIVIAVSHREMTPRTLVQGRLLRQPTLLLCLIPIRQMPATAIATMAVVLIFGLLDNVFSLHTLAATRAWPTPMVPVCLPLMSPELLR